MTRPLAPSPPECSRDAAYFEALYETTPDPWNFAGSEYEHGKYRATIAALGGRRFQRAFEIGCSIGVLTRLLAPRCDELLAVDIVESALAQAKRRCESLRGVGFANLRVPEQWPEGQAFDLILCSEILYFLSAADVARVAERAAASLCPGGVVLLVNYTEATDEPCGGNEAAEIFIAASAGRLAPNWRGRGDKFRIDRLAAR